MSKWPWPGDTTTDRARRIANSLLALLPADDRMRHIATAHNLGETWLGETLVVHTIDEAITGREAAAMLSVSEAVIRRWATLEHPYEPRPLLPRFGKRGRRRTYLVRDLIEASRLVRQAREQRDTASRT